ncbi:MAG TPA: polymer-forming cytoskeletal protein [Longimicrobium sp.]|nr:polymer-forming cytoskeletal protein [Longimicrobium sp.]
MALLGGGKSDRATAARERAGLARVGTESSMSIIGPGMGIVGDIVTDGTVRVEGRLQGTLRAGKAVVIGKGGEVHGDIFTQDAVIGGTVRGTVSAESRLELQATSDIEGMIRARAKHLTLEEGARFNGQVQMIDDPEARALPPPHVVENSAQG